MFQSFPNVNQVILLNRTASFKFGIIPVRIRAVSLFFLVRRVKHATTSMMSEGANRRSLVRALPSLRVCLHGCGGPQIGEVTCGGSPHLLFKRDQVKMRDYMDRRVTPPKCVTSPTT